MSEMKYAYSCDGERYHGCFDSIEDAFDEANCQDGESVWIGMIVRPHAPEAFVDADLVLDHISCQDEYSHECAEDWCMCSDAEKEELTEYLQAVVAGWIRRHKLEPTFFLVQGERQYRRDESGAVRPVVALEGERT